MKKTDTTKQTQEKRKGFTKKIGNATYDVSFHYCRQSMENMNDKIIRLIGKSFNKNSVFKRYCPMYNKSGEGR